MSDTACPTCGRPIDDHDRHVRLVLPDAVLRVPEGERAERTLGSGPLLQVQGIGAFVRVLLPIKLTGGFTLTIGTWLAIDPARLHEVWECWWTDAYRDLVLEGYLANAIEPWGEAVLGAAATASVRDPEQIPYVRSSPEPNLDRVLTTEWPHEDILAALPGGATRA